MRRVCDEHKDIDSNVPLPDSGALASRSSGTGVRRTIVGIGEALWDLLPGERHIAGAPLNFSYIAALLGEQALSLVASGTIRWALS
jgi:hypothetical protein